MAEGAGRARRLASRVPGPLRRPLARATAPVRARSGTGVVLRLEGEPVAARAALDSVLAQDPALVPEVRLLVADPALRAMAGAALDDAGRVRLGGLADTRRVVRTMHTAHVLVVSPGTVLRPDAVRRLRAGLAADGLPVLGGLGDSPEVDPEVPATAVHDLDSFPSVALAPLASRVLLPRRRLLAAASLDVTEPAAVLRELADGFRVVPDVVAEDARHVAVRGLFVDRPWDRLHRWIAQDRDATTQLRGHRAALAAYALGSLVRQADHLAEHAEDVGGEAAWADFADHVRVLTGLAGDATALPVLTRVRLWLVAHDRRADLVALVAARRHAGDLATTVDAGGTVRAVLDEVDDLPADLLEMGEAETPVRARVARLREVDGGTEVVVHAVVVGVEQADPAEVDGEILCGGVPVATTLGADPAVTRWSGSRAHTQDAGVLSAVLDRAAYTPGDPLQVRLRVGALTRTGPVREHDERGSAVRVASRGAAGAGAGAGPSVATVDVDGPDLVVTGAPGAVLAGPTVTLSGADGRFPLVAAPWGLGERPAPTGGYRLEVDGRPVPVSPALLDTLPREVLTEHHRVLLRVGRGGLVVRLDPPLGDDEAGPRRQTLLQASYAEVSEPLDPGLVYFQSFTGQAADHPLAIQRELHRRRPDLSVRWLVADSSVAVPEGAQPVQVRSREWYDVLARAGHVVTNIDLERWFVRRPGQQVLQTYHGYPSKRMGIDQWRARGFSPSRVAQDLARSSGTWTALVTPQPDADRYYREQYAYDGPIIAEGYPRNDALVAPGHEERRREARERLGAGDRSVLLYAPTWRDDLATNFRAARAEHHLDPARLAADLGPDWLVLLRGHRFHAPSDAPGLLDVTSYPDVNDLVLAADAAVLDYSSLRFDFALTGRPAVYLVPDLDDYTGRVRGFLQDYPSTAPGPMAGTTDEVLEQLRDLDALTERWSGPVADFNARFNALMDGHASERVVRAFFADLL